MVQMREPLLGCTFKSGTMVYLWLTMVSSFACIIAYLLLHLEELKRKPTGNDSFLVCYMVMDLWTAITGLYAIEKKRPSLLIPFLVYKVLDTVLLVALLVFFFKTVVNNLILTFRETLSHVFGVTDETIVLEEAAVIVTLIFCVIFGFKSYFAFIVRRYHQIMIEHFQGTAKVSVRLRPTPVCYVMLKATQNETKGNDDNLPNNMFRG